MDASLRRRDRGGLLAGGRIAEVLKAVPAEARRLHDEPMGQLYAQGSVRPRVDGVVERLR